MLDSNIPTSTPSSNVDPSFPKHFPPPSQHFHLSIKLILPIPHTPYPCGSYPSLTLSPALSLPCYTCCCPPWKGALIALPDCVCSHGWVDSRSIKSTRDHRASCNLLLTHWYHLHLRHIRILPQIPKTHQPASLLRIMGKHSLQYRHSDVTITHSRRWQLSPVPIPRLSYSDVKPCPGCRTTHQLT